MENFITQELKSSDFYKGIREITFVPESEVKLERVEAKGDKIYETTFWGNKKLIGEYTEDKYYIDDERYDKLYTRYTLKELEKRCRHTKVKDNKLMRMAQVKLNNSEYHWFDSNEDAYQYLESVKRKCLECGNKLL